MKTRSESELEFLSVFQRLKRDGKYTSPRGMLVLEAENFNYKLSPGVRFPSFKARNLKVDYTKKEVLWYLKGDKFDTSIVQHAKMWGPLINNDGTINSNYGQYIFYDELHKSQFDIVVETLAADKDSRRACMVILNDNHLRMKTNDVPCTFSLSFRIRNDRLNMSVNMRSQDAIFGMGNDAPAFSIIHEMVLNALRETYPDLRYGEYHHKADSFHVYERHFAMLDTICSGTDEFIDVLCPPVSGPEEVKFLRKDMVPVFKKHGIPFPHVPEKFAFTKWLFEGI